MDHPEVHSWDVMPLDSPNCVVRVEANWCSLMEGHLVFENINGVMIRAFAPGHWIQVRWVSPQQLYDELSRAEQLSRIKEQASEVLKRDR